MKNRLKNAFKRPAKAPPAPLTPGQRVYDALITKREALDQAELRELIAAYDTLEEKNCFGETAFAVAVKLEFAESAATLLAAGADINAQDEEGRTPLIKAAIHGDLAMVAYLIEKGADTRIENKSSEGPLASACRSGEFEVARFFLQLPVISENIAQMHHALKCVDYGRIFRERLEDYDCGTDDISASAYAAIIEEISAAIAAEPLRQAKARAAASSMELETPLKVPAPVRPKSRLSRRAA